MTKILEVEIPDYEKRLDKLMTEAFETNHPAMIDYIKLKFELKSLRADKPEPITEEQVYELQISLIKAKSKELDINFLYRTRLIDLILKDFTKALNTHFLGESHG